MGRSVLNVSIFGWICLPWLPYGQAFEIVVAFLKLACLLASRLPQREGIADGFELRLV